MHHWFLSLFLHSPSTLPSSSGRSSPYEGKENHQPFQAYVCSLLYCDTLFIAEVWNQTHNITNAFLNNHLSIPVCFYPIRCIDFYPRSKGLKYLVKIPGMFYYLMLRAEFTKIHSLWVQNKHS